MANTLVQLYIHSMFHVKSNHVRMLPEDLPRIFNYISGIIRGLGGTNIATGGITDHVHNLSSLPKNMSLSAVMKSVKSQSSKWLKTINPTAYGTFAWQDGDGAFSVSASVLGRVQRYVLNQAAHHENTKKTYDEEYREWLEQYHVEYDEQYAFDN